MPGMRMAKADANDIGQCRDFFHLYEYVIENGELTDEIIKSDWEEGDVEYKELMKHVIKKEEKWARGSVGEFDYYSFFYDWHTILAPRWRRVVWGVEILIESVCDPQKDYLDYSPYLEEFHVAPEM